ncbi:MAG: ABC transporter ATP-binding protein [Verrucomicrobiota bacterium]|nr:ABC transporter ATP-binding protein [Verrucomicrobiota bacterium]
MKNTNLLIELKDISFSYPDGTKVISNFNLKLKKGDKTALKGENGSGKTTLLEIITGLLVPNSAEIFVCGKKCCKEKDFQNARKNLGFLFQNPDDQLFCPTVAEEIAFGLFNLGKKRSEIEQIVSEILRKFDITHLKNTITYHLSEGEKHIVALTAILAMEPEVLLLDEPNTALDEKAENRLVSILKNLNKTILVVSHDDRFIEQITNKTIELQK